MLLGTLAQFHAVGIAWTLGSKDDSLLDLFPFLHKNDSEDNIIRWKEHLNNYQRLLEFYYDTDSRQVHLFKVGKVHIFLDFSCFCCIKCMLIVPFFNRNSKFKHGTWSAFRSRVKNRSNDLFKWRIYHPLVAKSAHISIFEHQKLCLDILYNTCL